MIPNQKIDHALFLKHTASTSKLLLRVASTLLGAMLMIAAFLFNSFYTEFKDLEAQVDLLGHNLEELEIEFKMLITPHEQPIDFRFKI